MTDSKNISASGEANGGSAGAGASAMPGRVIAALRELPGRLGPAARDFWSWFRKYLGGLSHQPELRFRTVLWAICIMFVGFFTLVGTNPFRLLIPDSFFHPPATDSRATVSLYGISVENQEPVKIQRRVSLEGEPERLVSRIAFAVSRPPGLQEGRGGGDYADLEPLPDLGLALRRVWFPNGASRVLIDLRRASLDAELDRFLLNRVDGARNRTALLDGFFRAYTASLFELMPELRRVEYLLDGKRSAFPGMQFRLDYVYGQSPAADTSQGVSSGTPQTEGGG